MRQLAYCVALLTPPSGCFSDTVGGPGGGETSTSQAESTAAAEPSSSGALTDGGSIGDTTASSATPGATTDVPEDTDSSGGQPNDCWAMDPRTWEVEALSPGQLTGTDPGGFAISLDGLSLLYYGTVDAVLALMIATRETLNDPWTGGDVLHDWSADAGNLRDARFIGPSRISLIEEGAVSISTFSAGIWWPPDRVQFGEEPPTMVSAPYFFDARRGLLVTFSELAPGPAGNVLRAFEARRADADLSFEPFELVRMPGWQDDVPLLCMAPAPDGEHMLFGGGYPSLWTDDDDSLASALDVWYARRDGAGGWEAPTEIDVLSNLEVETCPTSVTSDGCTVILHHFELNVGSVGYAVGTRGR